MHELEVFFSFVLLLDYSNPVLSHHVKTVTVLLRSYALLCGGNVLVWGTVEESFRVIANSEDCALPGTVVNGF